jgi:hypothetical protein
MERSTLIAIYAAVISTASATIHIANYFRDRTKVLITIRWFARIQEFPVTESMPASNFPMPDDKALYTTFTGCMISISNAGRRPLTLTDVALRDYGKSSLSLSNQVEPRVPCQLTEGQAVTVELDDSVYDFDEYPYVEASDALGRVYRKRISVSFWTALWRRSISVFKARRK